jgi:hypothetical protein
MTSDNTVKPIVHIATDEKFIDAAYKIYERAFPKKNKFLILVGEVQNGIEHLSKKNDYIFIKKDEKLISSVESLVKEASIIVFHGVNFPQAQIALSLKKKDKAFIWNVFGYEVYNNYGIFGYDVIGKKTYKAFIFSIKDWLKNRFRSIFYLIMKGEPEPDKFIAQSFFKMDFVGILFKEEIEKYMDLGIVKTDIKQLKFTYYPLDIVINKEQNKVTNDNILLGNSASYTNNHLEAFDILKQMDLGTRELITPLSYGKEEYANEIIKIGKSTFGDSFNPLVEFLPLSEYQKILQNCGIVIMNHYRQQAVGNVLNTMYMGAKVYLSNKNTLYHYLKRIGCYVYCIEEDLNPANDDALASLSKEKMIENRKILTEELSAENICEELNNKLNSFLA